MDEKPVSATPETDAHLAHLNTFDGYKIGIPNSTIDLARSLERRLREAEERVGALEKERVELVAVLAEDAARYRKG